MKAFFEWLGGLFKSLYDGIVGFFVGLWDVVWYVMCGIGGYILSWIDWVWQWIVWAFYQILDFVLVQGVSFLESTFAESNWTDLNTSFDVFSQCVSALHVANTFVPLDTLATCFGVYLTVLLVWIIYKFVKSWIPTVSG